MEKKGGGRVATLKMRGREEMEKRGKEGRARRRDEPDRCDKDK